MTTEERYDKRKFKAFAGLNSDERIQLDWIDGIIEQIQFANRPDVLKNFVLRLKIERRLE